MSMAHAFFVLMPEVFHNRALSLTLFYHLGLNKLTRRVNIAIASLCQGHSVSSLRSTLHKSPTKRCHPQGWDFRRICETPVMACCGCRFVCSCHFGQLVPRFHPQSCAAPSDARDCQSDTSAGIYFCQRIRETPSTASSRVLFLASRLPAVHR